MDENEREEDGLAGMVKRFHKKREEEREKAFREIGVVSCTFFRGRKGRANPGRIKVGDWSQSKLQLELTCDKVQEGKSKRGLPIYLVFRHREMRRLVELLTLPNSVVNPQKGS